MSEETGDEAPSFEETQPALSAEAGVTPGLVSEVLHTGVAHLLVGRCLQWICALGFLSPFFTFFSNNNQ